MDESGLHYAWTGRTPRFNVSTSSFYRADIIMSILTSVLVSAGKNIIGDLVGGDSDRSKVDRGGQLARFDQRLDAVSNPEKTSFKDFLAENQVENSPASLEYLEKRLQAGLLSDQEISEFAEANGALDGSLTIEKTATGYSLVNESGEVYSLEKGSVAEAAVDKLYRIESVLQMVSVDPTVSLDKAIDLSFDADQGKIVSRVSLDSSK